MIDKEISIEEAQLSTIKVGKQCKIHLAKLIIVII